MSALRVAFDSGFGQKKRVPNPLPLNLNVTALPGVGPERAEQLGRLGIISIRDLLSHAPNRYEDRSRIQEIAAIESLGAATVKGTVVDLGINRYRQKSRSVFQLILDDGTGRLHCRWWNMPYMEKN